MPVDNGLCRLEIELPAQPAALVRLSLLMADDDIDMKAASALIESDMALAAAVMKAVNSSLYGLKGRVQTPLQAVQYLGLREIAAITYEIGLRAAFPPLPELEPIWQRAARRGMVMGRLGQRLNVDAWAAHSAGLFEECGKAVLLRHAPEHYPAMLRAASGSDEQLAQLERRAFGVGHDALGAALCESWGLSANAVASVRHHAAVQAGGPWPAEVDKPAVLALSVIAHAMLAGGDVVAAVAHAAGRVPLDDAQVLAAVQAVQRQLDDLP